MIPIELAWRLRAAGVPWLPARGDRFVVPDREMDDEVFVVSDLTVELREAAGGTVLAFNGTTEWALDSLEMDQVLWLPREDQLRAMLGDRFLRLQADPVAGFAVTLNHGGARATVRARDAESAYALAVLLGPL